MNDAGDKMGEGPTAPHAFAPAQIDDSQAEPSKKERDDVEGESKDE